jgi:hypothetical protein
MLLLLSAILFTFPAPGTFAPQRIVEKLFIFIDLPGSEQDLKAPRLLKRFVS